MVQIELLFVGLSFIALKHNPRNVTPIITLFLSLPLLLLLALAVFVVGGCSLLLFFIIFIQLASFTEYVTSQILASSMITII